MTYLQLVNNSERILKRMDLDKSVILNIIYLIVPSINSLTDLTMVLEDSVPDEYLEKILNVFDLHVNEGVPLPYAVGNINFCGINLDVDEHVLPPRPETEEWTELLINRIKDYGRLKILDLCCGSGAIGLSIKNKMKYADVTLSDISKCAYDNSLKNARKLKLDVNVILGNLFENIGQQKFDVIAFNPPYVDESFALGQKMYKYEPYNAIYAPNRGLWFYEAILKTIKHYLKPKYLIIMEIGFNLAPEVCGLIQKYLNVNDYEILVDSNGIDRVIIVDHLTNSEENL